MQRQNTETVSDNKSVKHPFQNEKLDKSLTVALCS